MAGRGRPRKAETREGRENGPLTSKVNGKGANLGFEAELFKAADKLRGNMEPSDYKHVALGLVFLKYISDAFEAKHAALLAEDPQGAEDKDEYLADRIFWVQILGTSRNFEKPLRTAYRRAYGQGKRPPGVAILSGLDVPDTRFANVPLRYKAARSQDLWAIRQNHDTGERSLDLLRWGLVPYWSKAMAPSSGLAGTACRASATR